MGCDIHSYAEKKVEGKWETVRELRPFDWRSYGMYGFLADVRNYSDVPPIAERRGIPPDTSAYVKEEYEGWSSDAHSASWLSVNELASFRYDSEVEDCRVTIQRSANHFDGGGTCKRGTGTKTTWREFLGKQFFEDLEKLKAIGAERIIFWFDN